MAVEIGAKVLDALGTQFSEEHDQPAGVELAECDRHAAEQMAVTLFAPLQLGMGLLLGGDVHDRADKLELAPAVRHFAGDHAYGPDRTVVQHQPVFVGKVAPLVHRPVDGLAYGIDVIGMCALQDDGERRARCLCQIEDPERFIRPEKLSGHDVPAEAAGLAELLCLGEISGQVAMLA